jgi:predicted nucleic acid-binding protein
MRVIDSSAWIEWLVDSPTGQSLEDQIPDAEACIVPTIVQLELSKWLFREKGEDVADRFIAFTMKCNIIPLDTVIALLAADCIRKFKLSTADAIIYATALHADADLLTCDAHFEGLEQVLFIDKSR